MLEDGLKLEYDALLLATGVRYEKREFVGLKANTENFLFLKNFEDNQNLKKKLDKANKLVRLFIGYICFIIFRQLLAAIFSRWNWQLRSEKNIQI